MHTLIKKIFLSIILFISFGMVLADVTLAQTVLITVPQSQKDTVVFDEKYSAAAYIISHGEKSELRIGRKSIAIDGVPVRSTLDIHGNNYAYAVKRGNKYFVIFGEQVSPELDGVLENSLSVGSVSVSFIGKSEGLWHEYVMQKDGSVNVAKGYDEFRGGVEGVRKYDAGIIKRKVWIARIGDKWRLLFNRNEGELYEDVRLPALNAKGTAALYPRKSAGQWRMVLYGGQEYGQILSYSYDDVTEPVYLQSSNTFAYGAELDGKWRLVKLDKMMGKAGPVDMYGPNGKVMGQVAVIEPGRYYEQCIGDMYEKISHVVAHDKRLAFCAKLQNKWCVVIDGKNSQLFDEVTKPLFSADGTKMMYTARQGDSWYYVINGTVSAAYEAIHLLPISPSGKYLVYVAKLDGRWIACCNDVKVAVNGEVINGNVFIDGESSIDNGNNWKDVISLKFATYTKSNSIVDNENNVDIKVVTVDFTIKQQNGR